MPKGRTIWKKLKMNKRSLRDVKGQRQTPLFSFRGGNFAVKKMRNDF